jgi:hypothetical protein
MWTHNLTLWLLTLLFFLRVLGQFLVAFFKINFLPPMQDWYSGLLSYPWLLTSQILILSLQLKINLDFSFNRGFFVQSTPIFTDFIRWFSYFYAGGMLVRYVITMTKYPERRWFGKGTIPILFHFVLAGYLFAWVS